ncbi:Mucin-16 like [Actinidia chinensis var. chinensis]|uniref:Mucin-16 like n=1 Tax=Actinidia chinensis var. chinensis TaxID=1590841 RepID=A0A2R6P6M3_ACTCC|nr:Mucin-16 like [Actinidia chinensis var. chinensis]
MDFLTKRFRSILGLSNSEDQSSILHRNNPTPTGLRLIISTPAIIEQPVAIPESVAVKLTAGAGNEFPGETSTPTYRIHQSTAGETVPIDSARVIRVNVDRLAMLTESVGSESSSETVLDLTEVSMSVMAGARSRGTSPRMPKDFPPLLSSLKESGRRRFDLKKVRRDGRLLIEQVPNDRPEVGRTIKTDGRTKLFLIDPDKDDADNEPSREEQENEEREEEEREGEGGGPDDRLS